MLPRRGIAQSPIWVIVSTVSACKDAAGACNGDEINFRDNRTATKNMRRFAVSTDVSEVKSGTWIACDE